MAVLDDVRSLALALPQTEEGTSYGTVAWRVGGRVFVWERPLRARDRVELGAAAPRGPVLGARVPGEAAKRALYAADPEIYFTTSHFDGHASVLVVLDAISRDELSELITEAWLDRAPPALVRAFTDAHPAA